MADMEEVELESVSGSSFGEDEEETLVRER